MKHNRLSILRAQEAARLDQQKLDASYVRLNGRSTRFRDDPSYAAAVTGFEVSQPEAPEPAPVVTTVKRGFQVGDRVRVVRDDKAPKLCRLRNGQMHTISAVILGSAPGEDRVKLVGSDMVKYKFKLDRFELVQPVAKRGFQVGDRVRVVNRGPDQGRGLKNGDLRTITAVSPNGQYVSISPEDDPCWLPHRFELVEAATKPVKP